MFNNQKNIIIYTDMHTIDQGRSKVNPNNCYQNQVNYHQMQNNTRNNNGTIVFERKEGNSIHVYPGELPPRRLHHPADY